MEQMTVDELRAGLDTNVAFNVKAGLEMLDMEPGRVSARLKDKADNTNHNGDIAAGGIFTLGELVGGALVISELKSDQVFLVVKHIEIDFLNVGRGELVAESTLSEETAEKIREFLEGKLKKFEANTLAIVKDGSGKEVAKLNGVYYVRKMNERLMKKTAG